MASPNTHLDFMRDLTKRDWFIRVTDPPVDSPKNRFLEFPDLSNLTFEEAAHKSRAWINITNEKEILVRAIVVHAADNGYSFFMDETSHMIKYVIYDHEVLFDKLP